MPSNSIVLPTLVTKHVESAFFDDTRAGYLRFGTVAEYRNAESKEHRLSDRREGQLNLYASKHLENFTGNVGGLEISGVSTFGNARPFSATVNFQAFVFCASMVEYDQLRHQEILKRNASLKSYVVFDFALLLNGIHSFFAEVAPPQGKVGSKRVEYRDDSKETRHDNLSVLGVEFDRLRHRASDDEIVDAIFTKPTAFRHEEEFRVAIWPEAKVDREKALLVREAGPSWARLFAQAVVSYGP